MLKSRKDFDNLFAKKSLFYSSFYIVYFVNNNLEHSRLSVSINKKVQKLAVQRNKAKRQIKTILYNENFLNLKKDILVVVKPDFFKANFESKKMVLNKLIDKIKSNKR